MKPLAHGYIATGMQPRPRPPAPTSARSELLRSTERMWAQARWTLHHPLSASAPAVSAVITVMTVTLLGMGET